MRCKWGSVAVVVLSRLRAVVVLSFVNLAYTSFEQNYHSVQLAFLEDLELAAPRAVDESPSAVPLFGAHHVLYSLIVLLSMRTNSLLFQMLFEPATTFGFLYTLLFLLIFRNLAVLSSLHSQLCWNIAPFISVWLSSELFSTALSALGNSDSVLISSFALGIGWHHTASASVNPWWLLSASALIHLAVHT